MTADRYPRPFGKYVLLRPLARGGMGEIYLAAGGEIGGFEKICVIKKVLTEKADPGRSNRFLDEAKVVIRLSHANLVTVFDAGQVGDEFYIAMEYVEGKNLREAWNRCAQRQTRFPLDVALYVVREVCRGLSYAHDYGDLGLVHRDVSPPNILLSYFGEVKLTDFGLARSVLKQEKTAPGIVYGRYAYLSPEQARGEEADARTDLYSLGIILWELLTGRQLFPVGSSDPATALAVVRSPHVRPPSTLAARIPPSLDQVVLRALAPKRENRFQNADEMRRALAEELARLAPTTDAERVSALLRELYGDVIDAERAERERLLRLELPKVRRDPSIPVVTLGDGATPVQRGPAESGPKELVGAVIDGRYRIVAVLGEGGMGTVYDAEHVEIGKKVALKILNPLYSRQAELVARFRREARAASTIGHPNIVDVSDFGTTPDGMFYFVMERLEGVELGDVLSELGRLPAERAVAIATQMCRALEAAHAAGIIHRDLKPENVFLVTREGVPDFVKILDFGIAKAPGVETSGRLTNPGLAMGTPEYMAPEQAAGKGADARSDIYAVGAILYEMLVGVAPHEGDNALEILAKKATERPMAPRALRPELSEELERVVLRVLENDPGARPQTMVQLEYELVRSMEGRGQAVAAMLGLRREALEAGAVARPLAEREQSSSRRPVEDVLFELAVEQVSEGGNTPAHELPPLGSPTPAPPARSAPPAAPAFAQPAAGRPRSAHEQPVASSTRSTGPAPVVIVDRSRPASARPPMRTRPQPAPLLGVPASGSTTSRQVAISHGPVRARSQTLRARDVWIALTGILVVCGGAIAAVYKPWRRPPAVVAPSEAAPPGTGAPPPLDKLSADLQAGDDALARQHWLAPRGDNVYEVLKRLEKDAPGDPRVAALKQRTIETLERKGQGALEGGRLGEAEIAYRSLAKIDRSEARVKQVARVLASQAETALLAGRREAAVREAKDALSLDENQELARKVLARAAAMSAGAKKGKKRR